MGIGIVLLFWLIVGCFAGLIGGLILRAITSFLVPKEHLARRQATRAAMVLPFAGLGWLFAVFVFQATINSAYLDRDIGIGDSWDTPLPNGYRLSMIDVTDHGGIYNPKTLPPDTIVGQDDNVFDVSELQLSGHYMLGALAAENSYGGRYFLLDTRSGKRRIFSDLNDLAAAIRPLGITLEFQPIASIYGHFRTTWFDYLVFALVLIPSLVCFALFCRWVFRMRKSEPKPAI